jgi:hypothetical protein
MKQVSYFPDAFKYGHTIDMFNKRTGPRLSGFYNHSFWSGIVVQLGHVEPAIRNAIVAVTRVYEEVELRNGDLVQEMDSVALQSYTQAIRHVINDKSGAENRAYVSLIVCILFICLECLRGNPDAAAIHVKGGYDILVDWKGQHSPSTSRSGSPSSPESTSAISSTSSERDLMEDITALFSRLRVQSVIFGKDLSKDMLLPPSEEPYPVYDFQTLSEAREACFRLANEAISLIYAGAPAKYANTVSTEMLLQQLQLENQLQEWRRAMDEFLRKKELLLVLTDIKAINILKAQAISAYIWVSCCLAPEESQFDRFTKDFEEINTLAASISDIPVEFLCKSLGRFHFDFGIIPALHLVGSKCRYPHVRKEALRIMASNRWREGLFDSFRSYRYVRTVMALEERAKAQLLGLAPNELNDFLVPEAARIHFADMGDLDSVAEVQTHTFFSKPNGLYAEWFCQQKLISTSAGSPELDAWIECLETGDDLRMVTPEVEKDLFAISPRRMT